MALLLGSQEASAMRLDKESSSLQQVYNKNYDATYNQYKSMDDKELFRLVEQKTKEEPKKETS